MSKTVVRCSRAPSISVSVGLGRRECCHLFAARFLELFDGLWDWVSRRGSLNLGIL
jgi:hypothetical protein